MKVGCELPDGTLNIHDEDETCELCLPAMLSSGKWMAGDRTATPAEIAHGKLLLKYASAVRTLQDIAAMGKKAGSESAKHRLIMLGEPDDSGRKPVEPSSTQGDL